MNDLIAVKDVPQPLIEAIVVHEILRTIGVPAKDIYLDLHNQPEVRVVAVIDNKQYAIIAHKWWSPDDVDVRKLWARAIRSWNAGCNDPSSGWQEAVDSSNMRKAAVSILSSLVLNGAKLPKKVDHANRNR